MPMTTANKLTIARVFLIPVFLVVYYWGFPGSRYAALAVFIIASLTDLLDGYIARHYNQRNAADRRGKGAGHRRRLVG